MRHKPADKQKYLKLKNLAKIIVKFDSLKGKVAKIKTKNLLLPCPQWRILGVKLTLAWIQFCI